MNIFFRIVGIILCLIPMIGFGICGLFGLVTGATNLGHGSVGDTVLIFVLALVGLAIAAACGFLIRQLARSDNVGDKHS